MCIVSRRAFYGPDPRLRGDDNFKYYQSIRRYSVTAMEKKYYVYIMAKARNSTFYVGMTSDLLKRVWEHKEEVVDGFTQKHGIKKLVYFEIYNDPGTAIQREKRLKKWNRPWKMRIIEVMNPDWKDLYETL
jgi:putative endonuclease